MMLASALRVMISVILTAAAVAVAAAVIDRQPITATFVFVSAAGVGLFAGLPLYALLRQRWRETALACLCAGLLLGAVPAAVIGVPNRLAFEQWGEDVTVRDGVRTAAGWVRVAEDVGIAGAVGAAAGLVFWASLRMMQTGDGRRGLRRAPLTLGISLAVACTWTILALPSLTEDRSCHNPNRGGRMTVEAVLDFRVALEAGEWERFAGVFRAFAQQEQWSVDQTTAREAEGWNGRFISICVEPGTDITVQMLDWHRAERVEVLVLQPQGGTTWRPALRALLAAVDRELPGRLHRSYDDPDAVSPAALLPE